ncbi:chemosensory receptor A [Elysia marginata]|uniref:Chemosensory receptor A n=1 Tax=Elysia marginata TaxID=1093978 RepID=A0AAV4IB51_9GAST|nr:chemosensory receptor A [Elysia marginata]
MNSSSINESLGSASTQAGVYYMADYFLTIKVLAYTWPVIFLFGMVTNVINMIVFLKSGARDNVTILLTSLSVSDLAYLFLVSPTMCGFLIEALVRPNPWPFDYRLLVFLLVWPANTAYDVSCFIVVSLGVIRCACVAMPLKFKSVFTKSRTIKWLVFIVVLAVLLRLPVLTISRIGWRKDPATNVTKPYLFPVNREAMLRINDILHRFIVTYLAYFTMVTCVIVLSFKLYQASKIRQKVVTSKGAHPSDPTASEKHVTQGLSSRDLQVVKSVVLVCSIFIMAQLPYVGSSIIRLINPQIGEGRSLTEITYITSQIGITCYYINASVNIFIHYNFNSKYRAVFRSPLVCLSSQKQQ